jgi:hypothetical protein
VSQGYRPELDQSRELDAKREQYYQSLIGVLRWTCELGRIDVLVAVSMLPRYIGAVSPREWHLQQVFHIFAYLKHHKRSEMVFDDTELVFDESSFKICDWSEFYPDAEEVIPQDCPMERKRCHYLLFCGCGPCRMQGHSSFAYRHHPICEQGPDPMRWYSKRQNTIETSAFGVRRGVLRDEVGY